ncbi:hypothetical protein P4U43_11570 [Arthrobacter sp. EH-1B-1]|uniref:Uncharacterized protein n=1 Tax=Arthrobacter vasquezii TaxID=2977629 RepID=A0ABT6CY64_9MICC|nr:hypothetical protein [Arthrobacter vasquezii]MDF9278427.1 hypothetical protein [Arthrobacter vasquezii]
MTHGITIAPGDTRTLEIAPVVPQRLRFDGFEITTACSGIGIVVDRLKTFRRSGMNGSKDPLV